MIGGLEKVWGWLTVVNEVSRLSSCPFHCGGSCLPWLCLGVLLGFFCGLALVGILCLVWIFRLELVRLAFPPAAPPGPRPRLARYLE